MSWALAGLSLRTPKTSLLVMGLLLASESGVLISSRLMLFPFPRWSASLRQPLRMVSAFRCTPSSKAFYNISMYARPNSLPIFGASWSAFWFFFRDKGLGVPNIALLMDLFSVKEASEGFLYISKRATAKPIISNLPSSYKHWKEHYFFVGGQHWEYNPADQDDTLGIPTVWTALENLREFSVSASRSQLFKGHVMLLTLFWLRCLQVSVLTLLLRTRK